MYDEQLTFLESSDFADEQWYLRESAENIECSWDDDEEEAYNIMALEQAKFTIKNIAADFGKLASAARAAIVSIDIFIDEYIKVG